MQHADALLWQLDPSSQIAYHHDRWVMFNLLDPTTPGCGYQVLMEAVERTGKTLFVVTTNVDSMFTVAGVPDENLLEVHGTQAWSQCLPYPEEHGVFPTLTSGLTYCPVCGSSTRPNVIYFNDWSVNLQRMEEQNNRWEQLRAKLGKETVILEVGCGVNVPVLRLWSKQLATQQGVPVVRINPELLDSGNKYLDFKNYHAVLATAGDGLRYVFNS